MARSPFRCNLHVRGKRMEPMNIMELQESSNNKWDHQRSKIGPNEIYICLCLPLSLPHSVCLTSSRYLPPPPPPSSPSLLLARDVMSHFMESSGGGRARSRLQGAHSNRIGSEHGVVLDLVGELSGFPLIPCLDCNLARVVEGRTKKDGDNHGRLYFKCARNGVSSVYCRPPLSQLGF